ncbi:N1-acetylpolyamine oxidase [Colletotrichum lupini]|uniref:N1-acetylpolyamine oxidase n=1 Tax=Colletotrichum lupini TaxID=145971 RepID=A0A9Q8SFF1_9PEZI|nr:N1-acetylpolyamine oxidase [Colletotrichum lupini]UQC76289.1 N1-acetylpolyamine oxidase [Colletotrichum lupini]
MMLSLARFVGVLALIAPVAQTAPTKEFFAETKGNCSKVQVAILGAGLAGITAAQTLVNASITDFVIVEYNNRIGGRVYNRPFGKKPGTNESYFVELGANWKYEYDAGEIILKNQQDRSARAGLAIAGWKPGSDPLAQAIEWSSIDFEYANPPEKTSQQYSVVNTNTSFKRWKDDNNLVHDERGNITYSDDSVTVHNGDGTCIVADYAICTFSLGVLQKEVVNFSPELPLWKRTAIQSMTMGTYTKIFMQFKPEDVFWDKSTQFFLYADPVQRGYYPYFQSLDHKDFVDGSGIIFVTVVDQQSYTVEAQDFDTTKKQIMDVLKDMFRKEIPEPIDFYYHNWTREPWAYGSYSNWPPALTLEMHQNIRANLGNLWFAGEATHPQYFGFLQGAYYEGKNAGEAVSGCIKNKDDCVNLRSVAYDVLNGTTSTDKYTKVNGWSTKTFVKELGINIKRYLGLLKE